MDTSGVIQLIVVIFLVALSAFFSSAETALTTVNKVSIRTLLETGNKRAIVVDKILRNYGKMLSTILIGNNIVNISASSLATSLTIEAWGNAYVGIATGILTLVVLMFGEIIPKTWAMYNAEKISRQKSKTLMHSKLKVYATPPASYCPYAILSGKRGKEKTADDLSSSTVCKGKKMVEVARKIEIILLPSKQQNLFEFDDDFISEKYSPKFSLKQKSLVGCPYF